MITEHTNSLKKQLGDFSYYVYEHYADGVLIYVGKGSASGYRYKDHHSRNKAWNIIAEEADVIESKIVAWRENDADALNCERSVYLDHINAGVTTLTNTNPPAGKTRNVEVKVQDTEAIEAWKKESKTWQARAEARNGALKNNIKLKKHRSFLLDELVDAKEMIKELSDAK
tara:strand:+ start:60 stop:572 length:513 start_codon:yes stop_codon:yes gene_type:complete